jgi:hypothetical protein
MQPQHRSRFNLFGVDHLHELMTEHSSSALNLVASYVCSLAVLHICENVCHFQQMFLILTII